MFARLFDAVFELPPWISIDANGIIVTLVLNCHLSIVFFQYDLDHFSLNKRMIPI